MSATNFPETVTVAHAVPLVHVPPGSRRQEIRLLRMGTRASLRRCSDRDMEPVWTPRGGDAFHLDRDGNLWSRVRIPVTEKSEYLLSPGPFREFLEGPLVDPVEQPLLRTFMRTPLCPRDMAAGRSIAFELKRARGGEMPGRGPGTVLYDGRERGSADLAAFLENDVLVGEEGVYLRTAPLVRTTYKRERLFHVSPSRSFEPQLGDFLPMPDEGHHEACAHAFGSSRIPSGDDPSLAALRQAGALDRWSEREAVVLANVLPGYLLGQLAGWPERISDYGVPEDRRDAIRADALRGMTGSVGPEDAPAVVERAYSGLAAHAAHMSGVMEVGPLGAVVAHLRDAVLPRLHADRAPPSDDAEALGTLAP